MSGACTFVWLFVWTVKMLGGSMLVCVWSLCISVDVCVKILNGSVLNCWCVSGSCALVCLWVNTALVSENREHKKEVPDVIRFITSRPAQMWEVFNGTVTVVESTRTDLVCCTHESRRICGFGWRWVSKFPRCNEMWAVVLLCWETLPYDVTVVLFCQESGQGKTRLSTPCLLPI